jgi:hypothetical protein
LENTLSIFRIDFAATVRQSDGSEEPVIYVRHQAYDYNEQLVTKGIPNALPPRLE